MRVATVITRLNIGGASPPVISIAAGLRRRGHDSILITGAPQPGEGTLEGEAEDAGAVVTRIAQLGRNPNPVNDAVTFNRLTALFRQFRPHVVATHMSKAGALGRLAARLASVPVIVHTYHGKGFDVFPRGWRRSAVLGAERLLARLATGNIVVSEKQKDEFVRLRVAPTEKLRTINYGVDLRAFVDGGSARCAVRQELELPDEAVLVGVVGRLVAIKGQDVFLRAAAQLQKAHPSIHFLLVGDGESRPYYEGLARDLGVDARFLGWRRDMPQVLAALDIVALPTVMDFEGTPVAIIEALAAARAVVASDVGGVSEVVQHERTGLVVPPRDVSALARAIATLADAPGERARMGCAGQTFVCERYAQDRMVNETEAYYQELLAHCPS